MSNSENGVENAVASSVACCTVAGIARLLACFSNAVDGRRPADIAELFIEEGIFQPAGKAIHGPAAIATFYMERLRDPLRRTRHLWANVQIHSLMEGSAALDAVLTNYAYDPSVSRTEVQQRIGNVTAQCLRDSRGQWRFREHYYEPVFALRLPVASVPPAYQPK